MEQDYKYAILPTKAHYFHHVKNLADNMRKQDIEELKKLGVTDLREEIEYSIRMSEEAFVALNPDGNIIVMYGVIKTELGGQIWCLGTDLFHEFKKSFVCNCLLVLKKWKKEYGTLWNFVSKENKLSIRWLKTYNAKFDKGYMVGDNEFWKFTIGGK